MTCLRFKLGKLEDCKTAQVAMSPYICNDRYTERDLCPDVWVLERAFIFVGICTPARTNVLGTYNALDGGFYANSFQKRNCNYPTVKQRKFPCLL